MEPLFAEPDTGTEWRANTYVYKVGGGVVWNS